MYSGLHMLESLESMLVLLLLYDELRDRVSKLSLALLTLVTVMVDAWESFRGLLSGVGIASKTAFESIGAVCSMYGTRAMRGVDCVCAMMGCSPLGYRSGGAPK